VALLSAADAEHLQRTIELAEHGLGRVHPNPIVGATIAGSTSSTPGRLRSTTTRAADASGLILSAA